MEKYIITKGSGNSDFDLNAFDNALLASGIAEYNLVKVSSILPPDCRRVSSVDLPKGAFLHTAYSRCIENRPGITISAAIAIAIPNDRTLAGVIMEASGNYGIDTADEVVCAMAKIAMKARGISEFEIQQESVSMRTKVGFNCVVAAVSLW